MRYSEDHKAQTHQRIIEEAARLFRRDGVGATGLQPLMKTLGLTHGGFYAHFKSKDELVETALRHSVEKLGASTRAIAEGEKPLATLIRQYLSSAHRANPGEGCPLPTMSAELGQRGEPSPTTDEMVRNRLASIEAGLGGDEGAADQSVLILSAMVGALLLSRSVSDAELSDRLLKTTRRLLIEQNTDEVAKQ
ncbi:TetR/AcrR family transcriptional regulator [Pseudomonas sp.]|uniref:TetR/AcrR family transcriptional regulator n=1 Tax=Pseudomonas sp. TaxID=306 RepID=UPI003D0DE8B8